MLGVLQDKSSSSRILEDNFEVLGLGLGLQGQILGLGLEACFLDSITDGEQVCGVVYVGACSDV